MWIISWLQSQYTRIRSLAVDYYYRVISAAKNAYAWARDKAEAAYQRAKTYVLVAVLAAKVGLKLLIENVKDLVLDKWFETVTSIINLRDTIVAMIEIAKRVVSNLIQEWVLRQIASIYAFFRNPVNWLKGRSPILDKIISWYEGFVLNRNSLFNRILALFDTSYKFNIWSWLQNNANAIISFFTNPLRFLMAYWKGYMLAFLEWSLAYALGTEKYDLPPMPDWDTGGFGGTIIPGKPPPAGASGLVPPLSSIYVTGHPFRTGHPGLDLGLTLGQPVFAMHSGKVVIAGWSTIGYGFQVAIQGDDYWTRYAHLEVLNVKIGDRVKAGDTIGLGDSTGNSTGNHLHLEIKYRGSFIDPATVL